MESDSDVQTKEAAPAEASAAAADPLDADLQDPLSASGEVAGDGEAVQMGRRYLH